MKISQIVLELLSQCNFSCPYCRDSSGEKKLITYEDAINIIKNFKELGITKVQLDGGEPFLYKNIFDLIEFIYGMNLKVGIYTNGSLIDEKVAKVLSKYSDIKICLTIHPLSTTSQLNATFGGLKNLKREGIYPQIVFVVSSFSFAKLPEIISRIPIGTYSLILNPVVQSGRAFDNGISPLNDEEKQKFINILNDVKRKYENINIIDNVLVSSEDLEIEKIQMNDNEEFALHINTDGYVLPFFSADKSTAIGNVNDFDNLKKQLSNKEVLNYLERSKHAMKERIKGNNKSFQRKIVKKEII